MIFFILANAVDDAEDYATDEVTFSDTTTHSASHAVHIETDLSRSLPQDAPRRSMLFIAIHDMISPVELLPLSQRLMPNIIWRSHAQYPHNRPPSLRRRALSTPTLSDFGSAYLMMPRH
jgi:hypothetical protein